MVTEPPFIAIDAAGTLSDKRLPGARFTSALAYSLFAGERWRYEAACQAHAAARNVDHLNRVKCLYRRYSIPFSAALYVATAEMMLRSELMALGYIDEDVTPHFANPDHRISETFSSAIDLPEVESHDA